MNIPIRVRLAATYCVIFWISTLLLALGAYAGLQSSINAVVDNELLMRFDGVVEFLDEHVSRKTPDGLRNELLTHGALNPEYLQIDTEGGLQVHHGRAMTGIRTSTRSAEPRILLTTNYLGKPVRVLLARRTIHGQVYDLRLGDNFALPAEILRRFRWLVFLSSPLMLACAAAAGYWVSKRALESVSRLTRTARRIGASNLSQRVTVPQSADELQDLAETLNGMLERIEDAFRHVTQFTANVSHELRTPLALIRATAEVALLRVNANAEHYSEALHRILRETERNTKLLENMLLLARADASVDVLALKSMAFGPHIEDICQRVRPLAFEKGVRLICGESQPDVRVLADAEHLRRLWLILFDNAIRYTPTGGVIRVSWRVLSRESLACEISDNGIGISKADLPHIFERFFRADKARSREDGGAGLGLALAQWIVDAHHATMEVESALGAGSTFRVLLSLASRLDETPPRPLFADARSS